MKKYAYPVSLLITVLIFSYVIMVIVARNSYEEGTVEIHLSPEVDGLSFARSIILNLSDSNNQIDEYGVAKYRSYSAVSFDVENMDEFRAILEKTELVMPLHYANGKVIAIHYKP